MQLRKAAPAILGMITAAISFTAAPVCAGEYTAVEVGDTGLILPNRAMQQDKHYVGYEDDLLARICTLMKDVDTLLARLNALPPELADSVVLAKPSDNELNELFNLALAHNPELAAKRSELAVLAARTRQEGAKQDPTLGFSLVNYPTPLPLITHIGESGVAISLSQEYEGYGKRGLRRRIAHVDEEISQLELEQQELDLLFEIVEAYYDAMGTSARIDALRANIDLMRVLIELAERKYALGVTPQAAVISAQVELSKMEAMAIELEVLGRQQRVAIAGLLGYPPGFDIDALRFDAAYPLPPQIAWDELQLAAAMLTQRPDYAQLELELRQQELEVELAKREYHPDYTVMAEYEVSHGMEDTITAGVEIPLHTNKEERQDARVQEMYAQQAVTEQEMLALENRLRAQLETLQFELQMHSDLVDIYRKVLVPQARLALDSNIAAFAANMMDFSDLIMSQQSLLEQEEELQQNYIHILHTLADLQVVTAGVFDPTNYTAVSVNLDYAEPALSEDELDQLLEPERRAPRSSTPLVEDLGLPQVVPAPPGVLPPLAVPEQELLPPPANADGGSSTAVDGLPAAPEAPVEQGVDDERAADPADDFYAPFVPTKPLSPEESEEAAEDAPESPPDTTEDDDETNDDDEEDDEDSEADEEGK